MTFDKVEKRSMKKYRFKTNIQCAGCISRVTPYLDANNEINSWSVDIRNADKVLTVETEKLTEEMVEVILRNAGYHASKLNE